MRTRHAGIAAIAIAGALFLAPAAAGADPVITGSVDGAPFTSGDTGMLGQTIHAEGTGCFAPDTGAPGWFGEFVGADDPATSPSMHAFELQADEAGAFSWDVTIPLDNALGTFHARWYCASAPSSPSRTRTCCGCRPRCS